MNCSKMIRAAAIVAVVLGFLSWFSCPNASHAAGFGNATGYNFRVEEDGAGYRHHLVTIKMDDGTVQTVRVSLFPAVDESAYRMDLQDRLQVNLPYKRCGWLGCTRYAGTAVSTVGVEYPIGLNE